MRIIPIIFVALWLNTGLSFAENDEIYLECKYGGLKSLYKTPKIFIIARGGHVYDGDKKTKLNNEGVVDSYLFGSVFVNDKMLMNNIDIFNGSWHQYIITKDELMRIRNIEEVTKSKVNSYAGLDWKRIGECKSIDK